MVSFVILSRTMQALLLCGLLGVPGIALAAPDTVSGRVFDDGDGNGAYDRGESGIGGVAVSNGRVLVRSDRNGVYTLPTEPGQTVFVIKPGGWSLPRRADGLPAFWVQQPPTRALPLKFSGMPAAASVRRFDVALRREPPSDGDLSVLVFGDPQVKSQVDVGYYAVDIIDDVLQRSAFASSRDVLGISLGDIVNDDLSLYPALNAETTRLGVPWLHAAGNHDLDFDAARDEDSLLTFRNTYGPDSFAWEEPQATFVVLDDVIYEPARKPAYIGGFREDQFAFLEAYLAGVPKERLLVLAMHIPLFEPNPDKDSFRDADRARLFALLQPFEHVLVLSAHSHTQQHWTHGLANGWQGVQPLHEYNVGAACGAYWSGLKDADGIPDASMADGTPNGYARLRVASDASYTLAWRNARDADDAQIGLHAPRVLRQGAYPAWAVYANVYMGRADSRVEYRIDDGAWRPMTQVLRADPRLLAENMRDDLADALRGYDRSPEAEPSRHLWRGVLPTDLAPGEHRIEVRAFDPWRGEAVARTQYRLQQGAP